MERITDKLTAIEKKLADGCKWLRIETDAARIKEYGPVLIKLAEQRADCVEKIRKSKGIK